MRKLGITLLIVGLVVAAHFLVLKSLFKDSGSGKAGPPPPVDPPGGENSAPPLPEETKKTAFSFDYGGAVFGNIKEIPESSRSSTGILVDLDSGRVFWAKAPKRGVPIASMTKMMTALLAFEDEKARPELEMETPIQVTKSATGIGGSQLYLDTRETFSFGDMLKATMIMSANDASQLLAEFLSGGNTYEFVARMNRRAKELKMPMTKFFNPHGLPGNTSAEDNVSSPEGMILLARELLEYPQAVEWASTKIDYLPRKNLKDPSQDKEPSMLRNHNKLVGACPGVNGMKTGFTQRAKFCVTATCERGGRRMAASVTGFNTQKERDSFVAKLLDWGYRRAAESPTEGGGGTPGDAGKLPDLVIPK